LEHADEKIMRGLMRISAENVCGKTAAIRVLKAPIKNKDTDCNCDDKLVSEGSPHPKEQKRFWEAMAEISGKERGFMGLRSKLRAGS
jgi:hypothetical protein